MNTDASLFFSPDSSVKKSPTLTLISNSITTGQDCDLMANNSYLYSNRNSLSDANPRKYSLSNAKIALISYF